MFRAVLLLVISLPLAAVAQQPSPAPSPNYKALYEQANDAAAKWKARAEALESELSQMHGQHRGPVAVEGVVGGNPNGTFAATPAPRKPAPHLISSEGRLHVGTRLYLRGEFIGTVTALTRTNPDTGASERGIRFDYKDRKEYRPESAINTGYQVEETSE